MLTAFICGVFMLGYLIFMPIFKKKRFDEQVEPEYRRKGGAITVGAHLTLWGFVVMTIGGIGVRNHPFNTLANILCTGGLIAALIGLVTIGIALSSACFKEQNKDNDHPY